LLKVLDWAKYSLTIEKIKIKLLLTADSKGNTAWQRAAFWGKVDLLPKIWE
jgi:hypothetical protein